MFPTCASAGSASWRETIRAVRARTSVPDTRANARSRDSFRRSKPAPDLRDAIQLTPSGSSSAMLATRSSSATGWGPPPSVSSKTTLEPMALYDPRPSTVHLYIRPSTQAVGADEVDVLLPLRRARHLQSLRGRLGGRRPGELGGAGRLIEDTWQKQCVQPQVLTLHPNRGGYLPDLFSG